MSNVNDERTTNLAFINMMAGFLYLSCWRTIACLQIVPGF